MYVTVTVVPPVCASVPVCDEYVPATQGPPVARVSTNVVPPVIVVTVAVLEAKPEPPVQPDAESVTVSPTVKPSVDVTVNVAVAPPTATTTVAATIPVGAEDTLPAMSALWPFIRDRASVPAKLPAAPVPMPVMPAPIRERPVSAEPAAGFVLLENVYAPPEPQYIPLSISPTVVPFI